MGEHVTASGEPSAVVLPLLVGCPSAEAPPQGEDQGQEATGGVELPPTAELPLQAAGA